MAPALVSISPSWTERRLSKRDGFLKSSAHHGLRSVDHAIEFDGPVDRYRTALTVLAFQERNEEFRRSVENQHTLTIGGVHSVQAAVALNSYAESDVTMNGWAVASSYRSYLSKAVSIDTEVSLERLLDYARLEPAMVTAGESSWNSFPFRAFEPRH